MLKPTAVSDTPGVHQVDVELDDNAYGGDDGGDDGLSFDDALDAVEEGRDPFSAFEDDEDGDDDDDLQGDGLDEDGEGSDDDLEDAGDDDDADDADAGDDAADPSESDDPEAATEPVPFVDRPDVKALRAIYPDAVIENDADLASYTERAQNDAAVASGLSDAITQSPELGQLFQLVAVEGQDVLDAVATVLGDRVQIPQPDPEEDPKAYAQWLFEQKQRQATQQQRAQAAKRQRDQADATRRQVNAELAQLAAEEGLTGEARDTFLRQAHAIMNGDPVHGRFPSNRMKVLYRGLNHEALLAKAVQEAETKGRNEAIAEMKRAGKVGPKDSKTLGDGLPKGGKGQRKAKPRGDLADLASEVLHAGGVDAYGS